LKSNVGGWNWKQNSIRKKIKKKKSQSKERGSKLYKNQIKLNDEDEIEEKNSNQKNEDQVEYAKQMKWHRSILVWRKERNERIEEKSPAEPNYYIIAHMCHTTKKIRTRCF